MGSLLKIAVGLGLVAWGAKEMFDKKKGSSAPAAPAAQPEPKKEEKPAVNVAANPATAA